MVFFPALPFYPPPPPGHHVDAVRDVMRAHEHRGLQRSGVIEKRFGAHAQARCTGLVDQDCEILGHVRGGLSYVLVGAMYLVMTYRRA